MIAISQPQDPNSFTPDPEYSCVMGPCSNTVLVSERWFYDPATGETGTFHAIDCMRIKPAGMDAIGQAVIQIIDGDPAGVSRHRAWKDEVYGDPDHEVGKPMVIS